MTKKEYIAKRAAEKEKSAEKIRKSFKKHYKKEYQTRIWMAKVTNECNVSIPTVYDAIGNFKK